MSVKTANMGVKTPGTGDIDEPVLVPVGSGVIPRDIVVQMMVNIMNVVKDAMDELEENCQCGFDAILIRNDILYTVARKVADILGLKTVDPEESIELDFGTYKCVNDERCIAVIREGDIIYIVGWSVLVPGKIDYGKYRIVGEE